MNFTCQQPGVSWSFRCCSCASLSLISRGITFSKGPRVCLTAVQHTNTLLLFPENCHPVCQRCNLVSCQYTSLQDHTQSYLSTPLLFLPTHFEMYTLQHQLAKFSSHAPWVPWTLQVAYLSRSQEVSLYCFFSLVLLSVNTSTLTGVAIFISLIEE